MRIQPRGGPIVALAVLAVLGAACGGNGDSNEKGSGNEKASGNAKSSAPRTTPEKSEKKPADTGDPATAGLVGPGCADYAKQVPSGAGSVSGMAEDPVATAASNNPLLTTLVSAVSGKLNPKVNLVDTLNGAEFTVFAPIDSAFAKIPAKTVDALKTDDKTLTGILTYHVVPGQLAPNAVVGEHKTAQGDTVEVSGSGDELLVDNAKVICGGVKTSNATVYLIDSVLMPK